MVTLKQTQSWHSRSFRSQNAMQGWACNTGVPQWCANATLALRSLCLFGVE
jgi:hypothetical protein